MTRRFLSGLLVLVSLVCGVQAADKRPLAPRDLWAMKRVGSPVVSPDGRQVVFTVQEWSVEKNKSTTSLWRVDVAGGEPRRLTFAQASDGAPVWSPDGKRIAFTSKRGDDEVNSLYVLNGDGGEAEKVLELPEAISSPKWLPNGQGLVFVTTVLPKLAGKLAKDDLAAMKKELKRRKDSKITARVSENRAFRYWDHWLAEDTANRLVRIDLATKTLVDLTPGFDRTFNLAGDATFDISPDGKRISLTINSTPPPYKGYPNNDVYLVATDGSGIQRNLTPENPGDDSDSSFSPDGASIFFLRSETPYYSGEFKKLWRHDLATGKNVPVSDHLDYSVEEYVLGADGKSVWIVAEDKGVLPIFRLGLDGMGEKKTVYRSGSSAGVRVRGGTVVFLNNTSSRPDEVFALNPTTGEARALTRFNAQLLGQIEFGKQEEYWVEGAAGDKVHGWVYLPPGYDPAKSYGLVQLMHGGPHTMCRDAWSYRWNAHAMAAMGHVVTWVNRHGSTGFGEKFSRSILGEWGEKPLEDILKATDFLLKKFPNIDSKRMAAAGGSYGGYMAAWVAGHTDRFAAIINHAGVNDFVTQYGADLTGYSFVNVLGGTPWNNPEAMQRYNPTTYAKNFKTPMLIIHGEKDYRVPYVNGTALYGIYQAMGLPSRLVVYPDENHWILTPQNSIHWNWEFQSWIARWIGGTPTLQEPRFDGESK